MKVGQRLASVACDTHVVIVRALPEVTGPLFCGGRPMVDAADRVGTSANIEIADGTTFIEGSSELGKRYSGGGLEVLCVAAGRGGLTIDGIQLTLLKAKTLPASD